MASKYIDSAAITQIIGCIYKDSSYLDYDEKYTITEDDFPDDFHKIVYGVIYKLHELGASKITPEAINDFLETRPKSKGIFNLNKGMEYLSKVKELAQPLTFDYYYNRLKKMSLLRAYDNIGVDISEYYDPDNILDLKKKQIQEEWFDNSSIEKIADTINSKIEEIYQTYVQNDVYNVAVQAGTGIKDLVKRLEASPDVGVPLYGQYINTVLRGARLGKFYLRSAATGTGKAIPNNILIPTPLGMRKVGDIRPGDYLFGQDGKKTKVLAIHPQPEEKEIWKVYFSDGRVAECCKDHLWEYRYDSHRKKDYRVETTEELYNRSLKFKTGFRNEAGKSGYRFYVKLNEPVEYEEKSYYLTPYVMGALIGDGSFRYDNTNKSLTFSSADEEIPNLIINDLGDNYYFSKNNDFNYSYVFRKKDNIHHPVWVEEFLKFCPALWNVKSEDKFIPKEYLVGSIDQRFALLQGLMDTDGSIDERGRTSFTTCSATLRDNFIELCRSLGMITNYTIDKRKEKYRAGVCYTVHIQCKKDAKSKMFRLNRKKERAIKYINNGKREEYKSHLAIVNIEKTTKKAQMTCFTVDNKDHLFLTNDFIVTHNTRSMIADACNIACDEIYDLQYGWINNGKGFPTIFITTEQSVDEIQTMMLAFLSAVNEEHITTGQYTEGEKDRVLKAAEIIEKSPLYIETLPEFNLQDVENCIKRNIRENHIQYVCHDYIHSSIKILEEISRRAGKIALREDNILFMLSTRLKDICVKYGIFILSATQLSGQYNTAEAPDQNLLRGAKSIADKIDAGLIMLSINSDDLAALEPVIARNPGWAGINLKISIYKNRRGRYKGVYLWCKADLGICRIDPVFMTNYQYELQSIEDIKVTFKEEESVF